MMNKQVKVHEQYVDSLDVGGVTYEVQVIHRDWNPLKGHTPPTASLWAILWEDGYRRYSAAGATKEEVMRNFGFVVGCCRVEEYDKFLEKTKKELNNDKD